MTNQVTMPDGSIHEFPDEATPDMMESALQSLQKPTAVPETSITDNIKSFTTPITNAIDVSSQNAGNSAMLGLGNYATRAGDYAAGKVKSLFGQPDVSWEQTGKNLENENKENPIAAFTGNAAGGAIPYLSASHLASNAVSKLPALAGITPLAAQMASGGTVGAIQGEENGGNAGLGAAIGAAGPVAETIIPPVANLAGNLARSIGDVPKGLIGQGIGLIKPKIDTVNPNDFGILVAGGGENLQKLYNILQDRLKLPQIQGTQAEQDLLTAMGKIRNMQEANPLATAHAILKTEGEEGGLKNAVKFMASNNPLNYGGFKKSVIGNVISAGELGGFLAFAPDTLGPYDLKSDLSQYGGGLLSAIVSPSLTPSIKSALINTLDAKNKE